MKTPHFFKKCGAHAKAQNRTADTLIFSQVLYHLSYLGDLGIISARTGLSSVKKILTQSLSLSKGEG